MASKLGPATPSVIAWAIRESGFSLRALGTMLKVPEEISGWTKGMQPELAKSQAFAGVVERPFSAFLLRHPPVSSVPAVKFRSAAGTKARELNPEERRRIRCPFRIRPVSWSAVSA